MQDVKAFCFFKFIFKIYFLKKALLQVHKYFIVFINLMLLLLFKQLHYFSLHLAFHYLFIFYFHPEPNREQNSVFSFLFAFA